MARIRTIKPEFFTSEDIVELSPFARLLYIALWCEADRKGRMNWRPGTFKLRYFPADKLNIDACARELIERGLVVLYGDGLAFIPSFSQHQHVNPRESQSILPEPDASARVSTRESTVTDAQVGREGKEGKETRVADATRSSGLNGAFTAFWEAYPRKKSKGDAEKAWLKIKPDEQLHDRILRAVEQATTSDDWQRDDGKFIPYPASWLNAKGWEDSVGGAQRPKADL